MSDPVERHLQVARTARYAVLGENVVDPAEVWFVLHGYRQLARRFLRRFTDLDDGARRIVAPEALSRFYIGRQAGRHGPGSLVGATWMTREDREVEITDYVRYLDRLAEHAGAPTTVLGFSQGVATAARWVTLGGVRPARLILWGDYLPPDLDMDRAREAFQSTELVIVRGSEDPSLDGELEARESDRLVRAGLRARFVGYAGGHDIDQPTLRSLAGR